LPLLPAGRGSFSHHWMMILWSGQVLIWPTGAVVLQVAPLSVE